MKSPEYLTSKIINITGETILHQTNCIKLLNLLNNVRVVWGMILIVSIISLYSDKRGQLDPNTHDLRLLHNTRFRCEYLRLRT